MTTRDALEAALLAEPDDAVRHAAYADFLIERGDPRGEYVRLQLATEDRNQPVSKLRELEDAAHKIRQQHEREWLGDLWPFVRRPPSARSVAEPIEPNVVITWRRGWVDGVRIGQLSTELVRAIAAHPLTRLLGLFAVTQNTLPMETRADPYEAPVVVSLHPLVEGGRFTHLRQFEVGSVEERVTAEGYGLDYAVQAMPRLQSLRLCVDHFSESYLFSGHYPRLHTIDITYNNPRCRFYLLGMNGGLPSLRRLSLDTVAVMPGRGELGAEREAITPTDLRTFFRTDHLKALEHLTLRNGEFGDAGVEELLASGFINRLQGLDLCRCNITDDGARMLAAHSAVPHLDYLHLDNNLLSPIGVDVLGEVGVTISPNQMFGYPLAAPPDSDDAPETDLDGRQPDDATFDDGTG